MGEPGPVKRFVRGILVQNIVVTTLVCCVGSWSTFSEARDAGLGMAAALGKAGMDFVYWPVAYILLLPLWAFAAVMWEARKFGWHLGKQIGGRQPTNGAAESGSKGRAPSA